MTKSIAANWVVAISSVLVAFVLVFPDANAQFVDRTLSLRDLASQLKTPEAIAQYLWRNFTYESDRYLFGKDNVLQSPETMMETRKGDCEDFAMFAYQLLKMNGIKAFLFNVYGNGYGHSVCVFKENGKFTVIDGTRIIRSEAATLDDVAYELYPFWNKATVSILPSGSGTVKILEKIAR